MFSKKRNELLEGLIWNYGSLIVLSASGFLFNCLIVYFYDASILGVFNRTYAWYCVLSQIAVWGVHMSIMKLIPEYKEDRREGERIVASALTGTTIFSFFCVGTVEFILPYLVTDNINFLFSMRIAMPGLVFFSLNKILLNYLNGLSAMKEYAFFQSLRYIVIVISIYVMGKRHIEGVWLSACFSIAEIIVFIVSIFYLRCRKLLMKWVDTKYIMEHIKFGTRILPANMVVELNTKVDIICLGFVLNDDYLIGIYSFAVLFVEGFYQLYITVRRSINPMITENYVHGNLRDGIAKIKEKLVRPLKILSPIAVILIVIAYYVICCILKQMDYVYGIRILMIICLAIAFIGRQIIFGNIFSQTGFPLYESLINTITVTANFLLNLVFIYFWGIIGAAIATAVSHVIYGSVIHYFAKKKFDISI